MHVCAGMKTVLDGILEDVRQELACARAAMPPSEIRARIVDAPPVFSLEDALRGREFSLIAEVKRRSPSVGPMREENVTEAPEAYGENEIVSAVSVLTNQTHFGGSIQDLMEIRKRAGKPILRKDFLLDEYQVQEARAFGADAVLLIAGVLDGASLKGFYNLARELGMQVLFEVHTEEEIDLLPSDAVVVGINSRKFRAREGFAGIEGKVSAKDLTVDPSAFSLVEKLPAGVLRIAESGLFAANIGEVTGRFDAGLVGTSLLKDPRGIRAHLQEFQAAIEEAAQEAAANNSSS